MKKFIHCLSIISLMLVPLTQNIIAQSPDLVNYQAIIRGTTGEVIASTNVELVISILQGSSSGTAIYTETHMQTTNNFGLIGLEIGGGTTTDNFSAIDWSAGPYFIKVDVDGNEMSVSQIVSVPYAIYAAEAGNVFSGDYNDLANRPNLGLFITTETDPVFNVSAAKNINSTNITNWNTAYAWGNHASVGYLKTYTETDPVFNAAAAKNISATNITNWNTAFGWGNHASAGYLKTYTETDPVFNAAAAKNISATNITNWNTAFAWGNHANAGYLTSTDWTKNGSSLYYNAGKVGIGTADPKSTLSVAGTTVTDTVLFEVKNNLGQTIFAVYNEGVRITIDETASKGTRGGFAIGGFDGAKGTQEYFRVTGDSTRVYVNQNASKGTRGGFAIGGFDKTAGKGVLYNYVNLTPENYLIGHSAGENISWGTKNVFIGYEAGKINSTGSSNVFMGYRSGMNTTSSDNIMIGTEAGITNSSGLYNLFIGSQAGFTNLTGSTNIFIGYQAGHQNSSASGSVIIGEEAGHDNNASRNVFIGRSAGRSNQTGEDNVMVGSFSGKTMTGGRYNTFLGVEAGDFAEGGDGNVYLGHRTGYDNTGSSNVVIGDMAGSNGQIYTDPTTTYDNSVFVGRASGYNNTSGDYNVFLGMNSGFANETGANNTYLGTTSGRSATGSNNVFLGYYAGYAEQGDNKLVIESSGYTGTDNENNALIYGEFDNNIVNINGKLGVGIATPTASLHVFDWTEVTASSGGGIIIGNDNAANLAMDANEIQARSNGSTAILYLNPSGGSVGLSNTGFMTTVYGDLQVNGSFTNPSDLRLKRDIIPLKYGLNEILQLNPVSYHWIDNTNKSNQLGFIAQEIREILPELVVENDEGFLSVDYIKVVPVLVGSIKEQQRQITMQQTEIEALKARQSDNEKLNDDLYRRLLEAEQKINLILGTQKQ